MQSLTKHSQNTLKSLLILSIIWISRSWQNGMLFEIVHIQTNFPAKFRWILISQSKKKNIMKYYWRGAYGMCLTHVCLSLLLLWQTQKANCTLFTYISVPELWTHGCYRIFFQFQFEFIGKKIGLPWSYSSFSFYVCWQGCHMTWRSGLTDRRKIAFHFRENFITSNIRFLTFSSIRWHLLLGN